jgi:hypothetical protein
MRRLAGKARLMSGLTGVVVIAALATASVAEAKFRITLKSPTRLRRSGNQCR